MVVCRPTVSDDDPERGPGTGIYFTRNAIHGLLWGLHNVTTVYKRDHRTGLVGMPSKAKIGWSHHHVTPMKEGNKHATQIPVERKCWSPSSMVQGLHYWKWWPTCSLLGVFHQDIDFSPLWGTDQWYRWPNISLLGVFEWDVGEKPTSYLNIPSSKEFGHH